MRPMNPPKPKQLTAEERVAHVLRSQGRRTSLADQLPAEVLAELAALCSEAGLLAPDTRQAAAGILDAYFDSQKAVQEPEDQELD